VLVTELGLRNDVYRRPLATALERLSAHLEARRNHPLTTRRYYKKVDY